MHHKEVETKVNSIFTTDSQEPVQQETISRQLLNISELSTTFNNAKYTTELLETYKVQLMAKEGLFQDFQQRETDKNKL